MTPFSAFILILKFTKKIYFFSVSVSVSALEAVIIVCWCFHRLGSTTKTILLKGRESSQKTQKQISNLFPMCFFFQKDCLIDIQIDNSDLISVNNNIQFFLKPKLTVQP